MLFTVAVMPVLPTATAVTVPDALMVAALGFEDAQDAVVVRSREVPSL